MAMNQNYRNERYALGIPEMDRAHKELLDDLIRLGELPDHDFISDYPAMVARVEKDFFEEERAMEDIEFDGLRSHRAQHADVLETLHRAAAGVAGGDPTLGRAVVRLLPEWFILHILTLDHAFAEALRARSDAGCGKVQGYPAHPQSRGGRHVV